MDITRPLPQPVLDSRPFFMRPILRILRDVECGYVNPLGVHLSVLEAVVETWMYRADNVML
jgi:hypothetical protein